MNLPEMLREREVMVEFTPPDLSGKAWARGIKNLGPELAALVEADNKVIKAADELCSRGLWPDTLLRYETAKQVASAARATLVAKIGGKG